MEYTYDAWAHKFKSPNNTSKWQMGFNSAFKGLSSGENSQGALKKERTA
jgi:hypothetical protein